MIGIADLLVVVLIADAAQNAMASEYKSITEGAILVLTIIFWNYAVDWLGFRFPALQRLTRPPLLLIKDGEMLFRNMRQEMITTEELNSQLRQQGCRALLRGEKGLHRRRWEDQHHPERQWRTRSEEYPVEGNDLGCVQPYLYSGGFQA